MDPGRACNDTTAGITSGSTAAALRVDPELLSCFLAVEALETKEEISESSGQSVISVGQAEDETPAPPARDDGARWSARKA